MSLTPVISLGAGVQSSTLLLMAGRGELDDALPARPELAIFADTGWEPAGVYEWLGFLRIEAHRLGIEIATVTAGNLRERLLSPKRSGRSGKNYMVSAAPLFLVNVDGSSGRMPRQCTRDYKIRPVQRELRARGFGRDAPVEMVLGISFDELERMKPSRENWIENSYPLVEERITRTQCLEWFQRTYPGLTPPRSACIGCPFHSDSEWRRLRSEEPEAWDDAVEFDRGLREADFSALKGELFLHRQRVPLDRVALDGDGQLALDGFADECEGMCGV